MVMVITYIVVVFVVLFLFILVVCKRAPEGWQDKQGFHKGKMPADIHDIDEMK